MLTTLIVVVLITVSLYMQIKTYIKLLTYNLLISDSVLQTGIFLNVYKKKLF